MLLVYIFKAVIWCCNFDVSMYIKHILQKNDKIKIKMLYRLDYSETKNKQNREHSFSIWPLYILPKKWEININTFDYYVGFFTTKIWDHTVKTNLKEKWNTINIASQKLCLHKRNFQINRTYLGIVFQQNFKHF